MKPNEKKQLFKDVESSIKEHPEYYYDNLDLNLTRIGELMIDSFDVSEDNAYELAFEFVTEQEKGHL